MHHFEKLHQEDQPTLIPYPSTGISGNSARGAHKRSNETEPVGCLTVGSPLRTSSHPVIVQHCLNPKPRDMCHRSSRQPTSQTSSQSQVKPASIAQAEVATHAIIPWLWHGNTLALGANHRWSNDVLG